MSYCVNCGVELHESAAACPLCDTPVINPRAAVNRDAPPPFPENRGEVAPPSTKEAAILLSAMLLSAALCCSGANLLLAPERLWSLFVSGAALMLWIWLALPLIFRKMPILLRLLADTAAVGLYLCVPALYLDSWDWYFALALPIVLLGGALLLLQTLFFTVKRRSILSSVTVCTAGVGIFVFGLELFIDLFLRDAWAPSWSLIVAIVCVSTIIPLIIVRRVPSLREEARRRFHL